jgi:hypothetical protein
LVDVLGFFLAPIVGKLLWQMRVPYCRFCHDKGLLRAGLSVYASVSLVNFQLANTIS